MPEGVITALIAAILVPTVQAIIERFKHRRNRQEKQQDSKDIDHGMVVKDHQDIAEIKKNITITKDAQLAVLHDRLYYLLRKVRDKGHFAPGEFNNLKKMYDSYVDLGDGDQEVHKLWKQVQNFVIEEDYHEEG